jgi:transcriptional regulator with XRE-family HTH domain
MPRAPVARSTLPPSVGTALGRLGEHLAIARIRRKESQRAWAKRLGVSVPTLIRLERGDPGVGMGILATALWMIGRIEALSTLAEPATDRGALERDVREAGKRRRSVRSSLSVDARLRDKEST